MTTNGFINKYNNFSEFLKESRDFLYKQEIANNVVIGVVEQSVALPASDKIYLATYIKSGRVEGAFMMTPPHRLSIANGSSEESIHFALEDLKKNSINMSGIFASKNNAKIFLSDFEKCFSGEIRENKKLLCYFLESVNNIKKASGGMSIASLEDLHLIADYMTNFFEEAGAISAKGEELKIKITRGIEKGDMYYVWKDADKVVSIANISRNTDNLAVISGVYTPLSLRNRGYAGSLVAELSKLRLEKGDKYCCLYADSENPTSNKIYQRIGYKFHSETFEYDFISA